MTSTLRTFVSLTPLLQGPTFIAAGAGPAGQGLDARQEPIAKVLCAPLGSVPATAEPFCPALCSQLWLLQSPVLAPEAAQSLQGSSGCRVGKGGSSPGSTGTVSHTESHHLGDRDHSPSLPNRGRRRLTWACLDSDLLCCGVALCEEQHPPALGKVGALGPGL